VIWFGFYQEKPHLKLAFDISIEALIFESSADCSAFFLSLYSITKESGEGNFKFIYFWVLVPKKNYFVLSTTNRK
jgi:hypothetical protein